jgi:hypothetical protein
MIKPGETLTTSYAPDVLNIEGGLLGTITKVVVDSDDIVLHYADGRQIRLGAFGWEVEGIDVRLIQEGAR